MTEWAEVEDATAGDEVEDEDMTNWDEENDKDKNIVEKEGIHIEARACSRLELSWPYAVTNIVSWGSHKQILMVGLRMRYWGHMDKAEEDLKGNASREAGDASLLEEAGDI